MELNGTVSFCYVTLSHLTVRTNRSVWQFLLLSGMFKISEIRNEILKIYLSFL